MPYALEHTNKNGVRMLFADGYVFVVTARALPYWRGWEVTITSVTSGREWRGESRWGQLVNSALDQFRTEQQYGAEYTWRYWE